MYFHSEAVRLYPEVHSNNAFLKKRLNHKRDNHIKGIEKRMTQKGQARRKRIIVTYVLRIFDIREGEDYCWLIRYQPNQDGGAAAETR